MKFLPTPTISQSVPNSFDSLSVAYNKEKGVIYLATKEEENTVSLAKSIEVFSDLQGRFTILVGSAVFGPWSRVNGPSHKATATLFEVLYNYHENGVSLSGVGGFNFPSDYILFTSSGAYFSNFANQEPIGSFIRGDAATPARFIKTNSPMNMFEIFEKVVRHLPGKLHLQKIAFLHTK